MKVYTEKDKRRIHRLITNIYRRTNRTNAQGNGEGDFARDNK